MNCSVFVLVNKLKMSIDQQEEDRLISRRMGGMGMGGGVGVRLRLKQSVP